MAGNDLWKCVLHTAQSQAAQYQHERAHGLHNGGGFGIFRLHGFTSDGPSTLPRTLQTNEVAFILRNMNPLMNLLQGMQTFVIQLLDDEHKLPITIVEKPNIRIAFLQCVLQHIPMTLSPTTMVFHDDDPLYVSLDLSAYAAVTPDLTKLAKQVRDACHVRAVALRVVCGNLTLTEWFVHWFEGIMEKPIYIQGCAGSRTLKAQLAMSFTLWFVTRLPKTARLATGSRAWWIL